MFRNVCESTRHAAYTITTTGYNHEFLWYGQLSVISQTKGLNREEISNSSHRHFRHCRMRIR